LSNLALGAAKKEIEKLFGMEYSQTRKFTTKTKGAQEAHEAIRPTYLDHRAIEGDRSHKRLYDLIWKRTVSSQMSDALLEKTVISINISNSPYKFVAQGESIRFDGFLKVYLESSDEDDKSEEKELLPAVKTGEQLTVAEIQAQQKFTQQPPRYTEAMLVKKLEELGIGRPSTYAPIISTIQKREYVIREDITGTERTFVLLTLKGGAITREEKKEKTGFEKSKLCPTDIGILVNTFLVEHFANIMDYNFTATVEEQFDEIAQGNMEWNLMIRHFYGPFHERIGKTLENTKKVSGEKLLGKEPKTNANVYVKIGRYGPIAQIGDTDSPDKPRFAPLKKGQSIETISLEEALELFRLPRILGTFENEEVVVGSGRFGPYIRHRSMFYSLDKTDDPLTIELRRAEEIITRKRDQEREKLIREFPEEPLMKILKGRYGPYLSYNKQNFKIPKGMIPEELTLEDCRKIVAETAPSKPSRKRKSR
jgi:DNA topoisomerase-1